MSSSDLVRWGGLAAMMAGVLYVVGGLLPTPAFEEQPLSSGYYLRGLVRVLAPLLLLGGLVGLHIRQAHVYGWLGTAGFLLVFVSTLVGAVLVVVMMAAADATGDTAAALRVPLGVTGLGGLVGLSLLGAATLRARALPLPWAALPLALVLVEVLAWLVLPPLIFPLGLDWRTNALILTNVPPMLVGLGWVLLGYALWSGTSEGVRRRPAPVR